MDVVFVVDDSNSMEALQGSVAASAPGFFASLDATEIDYRIGVVTTDMNDPDRRGRLIGPIISTADTDPAVPFAAAVQAGITGSQLERGLGAAWAAMTPPLATHENLGLRREGARLAVVVVSDEDDCSDEGDLPSDQPAACVSLPDSLVSVTEYTARFRSLVESSSDVSLHALVETGLTGELDGCGGINVGTRYMQVARRLGGLVMPHCSEMPTLLDELALQLAGRRSSFPLSRTPDPLTITVVVAADVEPIGDDDDSAGEPVGNEVDPTEQLQGSQIPEDVSRTNGWSYDAESNTVRIWGPSLVGLGGAVQIRYQVATSG